MRISSIILACIMVPALAVAQSTWPKDIPQVPADKVTTMTVLDLGYDWMNKTGELAATMRGSKKLATAFKGGDLAKDFIEAGLELKQGGAEGFLKATTRLAWTYIKHGCPQADAFDLAAKTVVAGAQYSQDKLKNTFLDDCYSTYRDTSNDVYGVRQRWLNDYLQSEVRASGKYNLTQAELEKWATHTLDIYCVNRLYRERVTQVGDWLKGHNIPWSGQDEVLVKLVREMQALETIFKDRTHGEGQFTDADRVKLINALLHGGRAATDPIMAEIFSRHFGDKRDARGEKIIGSTLGKGSENRGSTTQAQSSEGYWIRKGEPIFVGRARDGGSDSWSWKIDGHSPSHIALTSSIGSDTSISVRAEWDPPPKILRAGAIPPLRGAATFQTIVNPHGFSLQAEFSCYIKRPYSRFWAVDVPMEPGKQVRGSNTNASAWVPGRGGNLTLGYSLFFMTSRDMEFSYEWVQGAPPTTVDPGPDQPGEVPQTAPIPEAAPRPGKTVKRATLVSGINGQVAVNLEGGNVNPKGGEAAAVDFAQMKVIHQPPAPTYPALARAMKIQGTVVVEITAGLDGVPITAMAIEGPAELRPAAENHALQWRFEPALVGGKPQKARFRLTLPFKLKGMTWDFERDGLSGWTQTGDAFKFQPTYGDNPTARNRGQASNQQGEYWIGTFEKRPLPSDPPGQVQGDGPQGTLTSQAFTIQKATISFLIGGGCDIDTERVELLVDGQVVRRATGKCTETMERARWSVSEFIGKEAQIRLVDASSGGWGHMNFDDVRFEDVKR
jgi:TonB family protein